MSIVVSGITKMYGQQKALDTVSFTINKGEIVGLLGPNGAGKSTMMKILTCFLPPSAGTASINDFDVLDQSIEVRKRVGYLPEHNPLYLEMYVREFLQFVAGIHQLEKHTASRIDHIIELTGLQAEQNKKIGALSKGYRQRVGLAQALIHDPEVLILDEPTTGLDPNQLVDIRNLIRTIGKEKTVILSTHIMQEVEAICDRVIIINKGKIVADDSTKNLARLATNQEVVVVEFDQSIQAEKLLNIQGVKQANALSANRWELVTDGQDIRADVFEFAVAQALKVLSLTQETRSIEDVFHKLTTK